MNDWYLDRAAVADVEQSCAVVHADHTRLGRLVVVRPERVVEKPTKQRRLADTEVTAQYQLHTFQRSTCLHKASMLHSLLARDAQAKLALIVAHILSICPSVCLSVRDSLSAALRVASHIDYRLVFNTNLAVLSRY